ncbi:MAG: FAD-dependent oxidoreductase [Elusimicrobia bacterium]|nr:FAD-dependent oxidoreductase [Elusimicrobiota bacterium]
MNRLNSHPVLEIPQKKQIEFYFDGKKLSALEGEMISSALIANGIYIFSRHHKDNSPQGIFCANGQCAQCAVIADGASVKSCITAVTPGMRIETAKGLPQISQKATPPAFSAVKEYEPDVLIIGGGPAGLLAAIELGKLGAEVIIVDDKHKLGGKLVLQTHKFFGSAADCFAGTRGIDIGAKLESEITKYPSVKVWLNSIAVGIFSDKKAGVVKEGEYRLIKPKAMLVAAGAREKTLAFPGSDLPGVYGAGAFQTLVNRDLIAPSNRLFIVGGGNVGLIAGYHAIQAGIEVIGIAEAMPKVGGYKVHADKIKRLGVPVYTSHSVISAGGKEKLESVTITAVDEKFNPLSGAEKTFKVDTLLIAVGLNPCSELYEQAKKFGINVYCAGDAEEIAEASAAIFSGKIAGNKIAKSLNFSAAEIPADWKPKLDALKSRPGKIYKPQAISLREGIFPVFHCLEEIPCDPCVSVCPKKSIKLKKESIMSLPFFDGECTGCGKCVAVCPGLAVTLVDFRKNADFPTVSMPFEIEKELIKKGERVRVNDAHGQDVGEGEIIDVREVKSYKTLLALVKISKDIALRAAGIKMREWEKPLGEILPRDGDDAIICRCERITLGEIKKAISQGIRDINQLKAIRACMGACGGKTCESQIISIMKSMGVSPSEITSNTQRPLVMEVSLGQFCNSEDAQGKEKFLNTGNF